MKKVNTGEPHRSLFQNESQKQVILCNWRKYNVGSFDVSWGFYTLFDNSLDVYEQFKTNREIIARRLPNITNPGVHPVDQVLVEGMVQPTIQSISPIYRRIFQAITIYSCIGSKRCVYKNSYIPKPNWQVNYNGLSRQRHSNCLLILQSDWHRMHQL